MHFSIDAMQREDITPVAHVHEVCFPRQKRSLEWISCNFHASPRAMIYVIRSFAHIVGYIVWTHKSGFRASAILELEQVAVHPGHQGKGAATLLITQSLHSVMSSLNMQNVSLNSIIVSVRADNSARYLYERLLGATTIATLTDMYFGDELIMRASPPFPAIT